jgi:pimeloyl-ACP methyl ester carboxylesterase
VKITEEMLAKIKAPVLVVAGEKDDVSGEVGPLVAAIPGSAGLTLHNRGHMNAVGDKQFKASVLTFLKGHLLHVDN